MGVDVAGAGAKPRTIGRYPAQDPVGLTAVLCCTRRRSQSVLGNFWFGNVRVKKEVGDAAAIPLVDRFPCGPHLSGCGRYKWITVEGEDRRELRIDQ